MKGAVISVELAFSTTGIPIKHPHFSARAALLYFAPSKKYAGAFFLLGMVFELAAWNPMLGWKSK